VLQSTGLEDTIQLDVTFMQTDVLSPYQFMVIWVHLDGGQKQAMYVQRRNAEACFCKQS
jgi:hypothetical protein